MSVKRQRALRMTRLRVMLGDGFLWRFFDVRALTLLLALCFVVFAAQLSLGDETGLTVDQINLKLDRSRVTLDEAHKTLEDPNLPDQSLRKLRERIDPLRVELEKNIDWLTPRLAAVDARLKELVPVAKPADLQNKPPEPPPESSQKTQAVKPAPAPALAPTGKNDRSFLSPGAQNRATLQPHANAAPDVAPALPSAEALVSADLIEQRKIFDATDATLKRARVMLLETKQISVTIVARMRDLFTKSLFLRTDGFFSPNLWRAALADAPWVYDQALAFMQDQRANFMSRLQGKNVEFLSSVASILLAIPPALLLSRRILRRKDSNGVPSKTRRAAVAGWTALVAAATPVAAALALGYALKYFDLLDPAVEPIWETLFDSVARIAFIHAIAIGVFAPLHPKWRLIDPDDRRARVYVRLLTCAALIISTTRIIEQIEAIVQASVQTVIITRGIGVMLISILISYPLLRLPSGQAADQQLGHISYEGRDWIALGRFISIFALIVIFTCCGLGYVTFANFLILQTGWIGAVAFILYVTTTLAASGAETALSPNNFFGRNLTRGLGVRHDQLAPFGVLCGGVLTVIACFIAVLLVLAPWGYQSNDFLANFVAAFFALKIGDVTISPSGVGGAICVFAGFLIATQAIRRWLDTRLLPLTRLDNGFKNSISATLGYIGFIVAAAMALSYVGIGFDKLAIVAGALSVGIGFGLQSIVNNFVSGLILLWERAIRVGDWVVLGDEQGYVRRINVRSTEIETFDRATMIVPNSNLVTGVVKNWLRGDRIGRIKIALAPSAATNPETVRDIMLAAARAQDNVLRVPAPQVMLLGMEPTSFKFELWCYVEDVEKSSRVRSDLHFDLYRRLKEAGVDIAAAATPAPTTILQIPDLDKLAAVAASALTLGSAYSDQDTAADAAPQQASDAAAEILTPAPQTATEE